MSLFNSDLGNDPHRDHHISFRNCNNLSANFAAVRGTVPGLPFKVKGNILKFRNIEAIALGFSTTKDEGQAFRGRFLNTKRLIFRTV